MSAIPSLISYRLPTRSNLPENTARWSVDPERAVLLVHDMQKYFMSFFSRDLRDELVSNILGLQRTCRSLGIPSAYSAQPGGMSEEERGLLRDFWGPGMKAAPQDRLVVDELSPERDDWNVTKWRYSAFIRSDLLERMKAVGRDQIILSGVYAHVGLMATAIDAFSNDIQPFFVADATADFSDDFHQQALRYVAQRCAYVTTAEDVLR